MGSNAPTQSESPLRLHFRALVAVYAVVPLCLILVLIDRFLSDGALSSRLPRSPQDLAWFNFFFVLPHIVASTLILVDREYVRHYSRRLAWGVGLAGLLAFVLPGFIDPGVLLLANGILTIYHVLAQQFGLAVGMARAEPSWGNAWKGAGLFAGSLTYYLFYFSERIPADRALVLNNVGWGSVAVFGLLTLRIFSRTPNGYARAYGFLNFFLIFGALLAVHSRYFFFAVLAPRLVHDLTAFSFYVVHDANRAREEDSGSFFGWLRRVPVLKAVPALWLTPIVAFGVAAGVKAIAAVALVNFLTLFHYWTERFTWRTGSPHRRRVALSGH